MSLFDEEVKSGIISVANYFEANVVLFSQIEWVLGLVLLSLTGLISIVWVANCIQKLKSEKALKLKRQRMERLEKQFREEMSDLLDSKKIEIKWVI